MKRCMAIIIALFLITSIALCEYSSMTDEELTEARDDILSEMVNRGIMEFDIAGGAYVAGVDIKPGWYYFKGLFKSGSYVLIYNGMSTKEEIMEHYVNGTMPKCVYSITISNEKGGYIEFKDGDPIFISNNAICKFEKPPYAP